MNKFVSFLIILIMMPSVVGAIPYQFGDFDPVRADENSWVCYDYAINYSRENPEWGVVFVSANPTFRGVSHVVNYKVEDGTMVLRDFSKPSVRISYAFTDMELARTGYDYHYTYYHICDPSKTPSRNYRILFDNLESVM